MIIFHFNFPPLFILNSAFYFSNLQFSKHYNFLDFFLKLLNNFTKKTLIQLHFRKLLASG